MLSFFYNNWKIKVQSHVCILYLLSSVELSEAGYTPLTHHQRDTSLATFTADEERYLVLYDFWGRVIMPLIALFKGHFFQEHQLLSAYYIFCFWLLTYRKTMSCLWGRGRRSRCWSEETMVGGQWRKTGRSEWCQETIWAKHKCT